MTDVMHNFELFQPATLADAQAILGDHEDAWIIAGGMDSLDWFKHRVKQPSVVVDIANIPDLHGIREEDDGGLWIGATTTLTEVNESEAVQSRFPVLAQAALRVASPQIRNKGTIGGNVSQDTRCTYYRDGFPCYRAGGNTCYANTPTAMNREHALFGVSRCVAVTPSDTAIALSALEAMFIVERHGNRREVAAADFFIGPDIDITRMTILEPGDILVGIRVPGKWAGSRQYFEKVADRNTWDFALANIAMAATVDAGAISDISMVCGAVQCTPRRLTDVESLVRGETPGEELETLIKRVAARGAEPLNFNHFKVPLMENLAVRAIRSLA
ncbi:FAD binding domain-containing protein [Chelativorans alearense]|uniref:FAD binding domain-containing protein n=1 Tax=Chelativorans alearense TaxID=2681495 RepID=UPI0013D11647|nr:FAD binding domain-containing protein [Chelativorans alearense]